MINHTVSLRNVLPMLLEDVFLAVRQELWLEKEAPEHCE
jgi:hypothetical protein